MFLNGVKRGSPRNSEAKNPPAKTTIIVDSQHAIGCFREKGMEPKLKNKNKFLLVKLAGKSIT